MTSHAAFASIFREIPGAPLRGFFFRGIRLKYVATPLSAMGSKPSGGRYNAAGTFEVYYLAPNADAVLRETRAVDPSSIPKRIAPLTLFTVDVDLQHVVDLTNDETLHALGVARAELTMEWRAIVLDGKTPITHQIGASAHLANIEALIYPSARLPGATNLAVIADKLRRGSSLRVNPADGFGPGATIEIIGTR